MKFALPLGMAMLLVVASFGGSPPASSTKIARGKYIVEGVGLCNDCHTPMDEKGQPIPGKALKGAPTAFKPVAPIPNWAEKSPNIAGLPGWEDADAVKFLMTGIAYNGLPPRPPMPPYRMNKEDAEAVVAYLRSLGPQ